MATRDEIHRLLDGVPDDRGRGDRRNSAPKGEVLNSRLPHVIGLPPTITPHSGQLCSSATCMITTRWVPASSSTYWTTRNPGRSNRTEVPSSMPRALSVQRHAVTRNLINRQSLSPFLLLGSALSQTARYRAGPTDSARRTRPAGHLVPLAALARPDTGGQDRDADLVRPPVEDRRP